MIPSVILLKVAVSGLNSRVPYLDTSVAAAHWRKHFWNDDLWTVSCLVAVGQSSQHSNDRNTVLRVCCLVVVFADGHVYIEIMTTTCLSIFNGCVLLTTKWQNLQ